MSHIHAEAFSGPRVGKFHQKRFTDRFLILTISLLPICVAMIIVPHSTVCLPAHIGDLHQTSSNFFCVR